MGTPRDDGEPIVLDAGFLSLDTAGYDFSDCIDTDGTTVVADAAYTQGPLAKGVRSKTDAAPHFLAQAGPADSLLLQACIHEAATHLPVDVREDRASLWMGRATPLQEERVQAYSRKKEPVRILIPGVQTIENTVFMTLAAETAVEGGDAPCSSSAPPTRELTTVFDDTVGTAVERFFRAVYGDVCVWRNASAEHTARVRDTFGFVMRCAMPNEKFTYGDRMEGRVVGVNTARDLRGLLRPWTKQFMQKRIDVLRAKLGADAPLVRKLAQQLADAYAPLPENDAARGAELAQRKKANAEKRWLPHVADRACDVLGIFIHIRERDNFRLWNAGSRAERTRHPPLLTQITEFSYNHAAPTVDNIFMQSPLLPVCVYAPPLLSIFRYEPSGRGSAIVMNSFAVIRYYLSVLIGLNAHTRAQEERTAVENEKDRVEFFRKHGRKTKRRFVPRDVTENNPTRLNAKRFDAILAAVFKNMVDILSGLSDELQTHYAGWKREPADSMHYARFGKAMHTKTVELIHVLENAVMDMYGTTFHNELTRTTLRTPVHVPHVSLITPFMREDVMFLTDLLMIEREDAAGIAVPSARYTVDTETGGLAMLRDAEREGTVIQRFGAWLFDGADDKDLIGNLRNMYEGYADSVKGRHAVQREAIKKMTKKLGIDHQPIQEPRHEEIFVAYADLDKRLSRDATRRKLMEPIPEDTDKKKGKGKEAAPAYVRPENAIPGVYELNGLIEFADSYVSVA